MPSTGTSRGHSALLIGAHAHPAGYRPRVRPDTSARAHRQDSARLPPRSHGGTPRVGLPYTPAPPDGHALGGLEAPPRGGLGRALSPLHLHPHRCRDTRRVSLGCRSLRSTCTPIAVAGRCGWISKGSLTLLRFVAKQHHPEPLEAERRLLLCTSQTNIP